MPEFITPQLLHNTATVLTLVLLESLLSADNALVLAVMVKHLPAEQRGKALRYGLLGAFLFRAFAILLAAWAIHLWYFKAAGAAYLLYLCGAHFWRELKLKKGALQAGEMKAGSFWKTVALVELADAAFSADSILAAVGLSNEPWVIFLGGALGIVAMRFVAQAFIKLLERYHALEASAYLMVGWIGLKLGVETAAQRLSANGWHGLPAWLFWSVMTLILIGGLKKKT